MADNYYYDFRIHLLSTLPVITQEIMSPYMTDAMKYALVMLLFDYVILYLMDSLGTSSFELSQKLQSLMAA